ncbi:MAG: hypothetical protein K2K13_03880 [Clostridiales bacterium]|nr:hypothetical protein [Clostridiales bacterium]
MENKNLKLVVYILTGMVGFGLGLIAVSLFMSFVDLNVNPVYGAAMGMESAALKLFESEDWSMLDLSPAFVIISYLVLIVGLIIVAADASIKQKLKRKIKGLNYGGLAVTAVGFVLLIVSIFITKGQAADAMDRVLIAMLTEAGITEIQAMTILEEMISYGLGIGSVMAIVGGVIALIGSILLVIPAFDPIKLSEEPAANTAAQAPTAPVAEQPAAPATEANDDTNNDTIA